MGNQKTMENGAQLTTQDAIHLKLFRNLFENPRKLYKFK
jgi:hypothetical protein